MDVLGVFLWSMGERLYRTQILLRPEQHSRLVRISREEGTSISHVARTLIDEALVAHPIAAWAAREPTLGHLRALRESIQAANGMITVDLVGEARAGSSTKESSTTRRWSCSMERS
ncbi:MAG: hypothetical protein OXQ31_22170 [Spirochaetaceae bacterium]|nr:hypothetical protein [Spirochaetaceae bacterium]